VSTILTAQPWTSPAEKLERAHYRAALLAAVAGLLGRGQGECPPEVAFGRLETDLRELADLLREIRQERGA